MSTEAEVAEDQSRPARVRRTLLAAALYVMPALVALQPPVVDPDIWWHLATARWIVEHGWVPQTDPFSQYGQGRPWMAYSWLFELLVYGLYQQAGLFGIVLLRVAGTLAVTSAIHRLVARREARLLPALGLTLLGAIAVGPIMQERSWMFSILFYALTLDVLLDVYQGRPNPLIWGLPLCYALWANIHIQFINGLFLFGLTLGAELLEAILGRIPPERKDAWRQAVVRLFRLTGACILATLANPYTWRLYLAILDLPTQTGAFQWIGELRSPGFRGFPDWIMLGLTCLAAFALGRRAWVGVFEVLLLTTGAGFAFRAQRDTWLIILPALAILTTGAQPGPPHRVTLRQRLYALALGTTLVAVLLAAAIRQQGITEDWLREELAKRYPVAAVEYVAARAYPGPLYNHYNWGGYLIWALPQRPVSMDGRSYLHGDARMERSFHTWDGLRNWKGESDEGWRTDPELAQAKLVIAQAETALVSLLQTDARFRQVYEDKVAVVFVARDEQP